MTSFSQIRKEQIKFDCCHYSGYKPCGRFDGCPDCPHYAPRGEQILIIKLGAMGDVLRTKVILPGLKKQHPTSWIVWLTTPGSECIVRDPLVDEIVTFTPEGLMSLEGRQFSRLLCLDKDKHAVALSIRLDADRRQGFAPTAYNTISVWNDASMYALRLGLSDPLKFRENQKSMPAIIAEMCEVEYDESVYTLTISAAARTDATARWASTGVPSGRRVIGLNTGCGPVFATKGWPRGNMAEFVKCVSRRDNIAVVLLGGPRERDIHEYIRTECKDLLGKTLFDAGNDNALEVFFGLVDQCDVLLSADSLAMHVGIALGKQVIAWFGATCHQEVDLFGRGEKVVSGFACSPCYLKTCPQPVFCMEAMKAEEVERALDRVLMRLDQ